MPICKQCGEEVDELVTAQLDGKAKKVCSDCAELAEEQSAVAQESEAVVQNMMGYKGRR
jgi:ribosome-binding protein aMBF1 (putative translation factor)